MYDLNDPRDLESFATALADELPGQWRSEYHRHTGPDDQLRLAKDVWDLNLVAAAIAQAVLEHDAVLTRDDGARLYVTGRPHHDEEYLVAAMAPTGVTPDAFRGVREPDGIVVPDDPFQAADDVTADLLPRYDKAAAQVQHNATHPTPTPPASAPTREQVVMTWVGDGSLAAKTRTREAARALRDNGFTWDPGNRVFVLSGDDTAHQARCVRAAGAQLATHSIDVLMRPQKQPSLDTTPPAAAQRMQPARTR